MRAGFAVVWVSDRNRDEVNLPDLDEWLDQVAGASSESFGALADLDLVDPDRWPAALLLIAGDRDARQCLHPTPSGLSYSGWWLSRHALLDDRPPAEWRLGTADDLAGLYDPLPVALDEQFARSIGVLADLAAAAATDPEDLLERLADPSRLVPAGTVAALTWAVVSALAGVEDIDLPSGVRTLSGGVVDANAAAVLDHPWLAQVLPASGLVAAAADPALVARVLDLPLASESVRDVLVGGAAVVESAGDLESTAAAASAGDRIARAAAAVGLHLADLQIAVVPELSVAVAGADPVPVRWWCRDDRGWVDGSAEAVGRAVAWAAGAWSDRHRAIAAAGEDWLALAEDAVS